MDCLVYAKDLIFYWLYSPTLLLCLQSDLLQLLQPFGVVSKIVMLRAKNQVGYFSFQHLAEQMTIGIAYLWLFRASGSSADGRHTCFCECAAILHFCSTQHKVMQSMRVGCNALWMQRAPKEIFIHVLQCKLPSSMAICLVDNVCKFMDADDINFLAFCCDKC